MGEIRGIVPATLTPFDADGQVSPLLIKRLVRHLLAAGVHGLFVCGSSGEAMLMESSERQRVAEIFVEEVGGQVPVIVHVGTPGSDIAAQLGRHAQSIGA
ncbi:MAG: dihydrodipicolinate synthase family protein, partial [Deinococcus sp.]|nr:dihydrodipicolinate synthase family protein [Deinococcus sp.]